MPRLIVIILREGADVLSQAHAPPVSELAGRGVRIILSRAARGRTCLVSFSGWARVSVGVSDAARGQSVSVPKKLALGTRVATVARTTLIHTFGESVMRALALSFVAAVILSMPSAVSAVQYESNGKVVHTRLAPVVMHRVSPPFRGQHVYSGCRGRR